MLKFLNANLNKLIGYNDFMFYNIFLILVHIVRSDVQKSGNLNVKIL